MARKLRCSKPKVDPGGGGINVSRVVHRLGGETLALSCRRRADRHGPRRSAQKREEVPAESCTIEDETREDIAVRETDTGKVLRFVTPGPELRPREREDLLSLLSRRMSRDALVVGSGSLPGGVGRRFSGPR